MNRQEGNKRASEVAFGLGAREHGALLSVLDRYRISLTWGKLLRLAAAVLIVGGAGWYAATRTVMPFYASADALVIEKAPVTNTFAGQLPTAVFPDFRLYGDGTAIYKKPLSGSRYLSRDFEVVTAKLSYAEMMRLIRQFKKERFFAANDEYAAQNGAVSQGKVLTLTLRSGSKTVTVHDAAAAPDGLKHLLKTLDEFSKKDEKPYEPNTIVVRAVRVGNPQYVMSLVKPEQWDRKPSLAEIGPAGRTFKDAEAKPVLEKLHNEFVLYALENNELYEVIVEWSLPPVRKR